MSEQARSQPANKYAGNCTKCGAHVPANGGVRRRVDNKWTVEHRDGDCGKEQEEVAEVAVAPVVDLFPPTAEQQACIDLAMTGESMVIEALAGAGKTTVLRQIANALPDKRMRYLAFNKAIVTDVAGSMPRNVTASTAHSLAFQAIGKQYASRLKSGRVSNREVAARLGIDPWACKIGDQPKVLSPEYLAGYVMRAVSNFCKTADEEPTTRHFPYVDAIDVSVEGKREYVNNNRLAGDMLGALQRAWADLSKTEGALRFGHDHYLKLYQLSHPRIDVDVILFDECQDANPVMFAIVAEQEHAQRIMVGDAQQAIYEFTGAINAIEKQKEAGWPVRTLSQSFRFGPAIAEVANGVLAELTELRVVGLESIASTAGATDEDCNVVLCRTNARAIEEVMAALAESKQPYLVGGGREVVQFAKAAQDLMAGRSTQHPELACFDSWSAVEAFVQQDEQGDELRLLVGLVQKYGVAAILSALDDMADERDADLIVSTAHKSKGRQWGRVRIAGDFVKKDEGMPDPGELRLRYVAFTRAQLHLDHSALVKPPEDPDAAEEEDPAREEGTDLLAAQQTGQDAVRPSAEVAAVGQGPREEVTASEPFTDVDSARYLTSTYEERALRSLARQRLTVAQAVALNVLEAAGGPVDLDALAAALDTTRTGAGQTAASLVRHGLARRAGKRYEAIR